MPHCSRCLTGGLTDPIFAYSHLKPGTTGGYGKPGELIGTSITGGAFVPAASWPTSYHGDYLFADYSGWIGQLEPNGQGGFNATTFASGLGPLIALSFGPAQGGQALYYTTYANRGEIHRITYNGSAANQPPAAVLTSDRASGNLPLTVAFDGRGSSDPNAGDILSYSWDFGDGTVLTTTAATATYTYTRAGSYTASLRVQDQKGAVSAPATLQIAAGNTAHTAQILTPSKDARYKVGETISLTGRGTDSEDGTLDGNKLSWSVGAITTPGHPPSAATC